MSHFKFFDIFDHFLHAFIDEEEDQINKHRKNSFELGRTSVYAPSIASSAVAVDLENQLQKKVDNCSRLIKLHNRIHELEEATKLPPVQGTDIKLRYLILDFSCVSYIDTDGMSLIAKLATDLKSLNIRLQEMSSKKKLFESRPNLRFIMTFFSY